MPHTHRLTTVQASLRVRQERSERRSRLLSLLPVTLFYLVFLVAPYVLMFRMSLNEYSALTLFREAYTLQNYVDLLKDPFYLRLFARTIGLGLVVTVVSLLLGYPLAVKIMRETGLKKTLMIGVVLSPLLLNLVVRTYAWLVLLGDKGVVNSTLASLGLISTPLPIQGSLSAVIIGMTHITLPMMILSLIGVLEQISPSTFEAARSLGASESRVFFRVIIPQSLHGISSGSLLVFCFTISAFVMPALLGGHRISTVSTVIYEKFTFAMNWPVGAALLFILLLLNCFVIVLHSYLFRER